MNKNNLNPLDIECPEDELNNYFIYGQDSVRKNNIGKSDYAKHKIQPWDIWMEYHLNPWDADIVKRVLRTKKEACMTESESRKLDYQKIIHICLERIRQINEGYKF